MSRSPMLWGAGLACAMAGAVAGTSLGSSPVVAAAAPVTYYQHHEESGSVAVDRQPVMLADRYPLVTPRGTIPVEKLSERGLFSQARYRMVDPQPYAGPPLDAPTAQAAARPAATNEPGQTELGTVRVSRGERSAQTGFGTPANPVGETVLAL